MDVLFDGPHTCQIQGFFHWWPLPPAVPSTSSCLSRNSSGHPMMTTLYNHQHCYRHRPALTPIHQHHLNHRLIHHWPFLHCRSWLFHYPWHHSPSPLGLLRFWYRDSQSLLLYATVRCRYGKAAMGSIGSEFILMKTLLDSKQCWRVSLRLRRSSLIRHLSEL